MAINFIKNLSQLITGGIGIVDDELVYKDSEGNVKTTATDFEAVEEIPESLDPGQIVLVTDPLAYGLWRGFEEGETGEDAGTPFPIKGYKEVVVRSRAPFEDSFVLIDETGENASLSDESGFYLVNFDNDVFEESSQIVEDNKPLFSGLTPTGRIATIRMGAYAPMGSLARDKFQINRFSWTTSDGEEWSFSFDDGITGSAQLALRIYPKKPE